MKFFLSIPITLLFIYSSVCAKDKGDFSLGLSVMFGGRYDDIRMCVATPAGKKGGMIADIMLDLRYHFDDNTAAVFNVPVMRPILFAAAFEMLQFEPQFILEQQFRINDDLDFVLGPGIGVSLHYGPDYKTARDAQNVEKFFAVGPHLTSLFGLQFRNEANRTRTVGLKTFYTPLFSPDYRNGTVFGAVLEGRFDFYSF